MRSNTKLLDFQKNILKKLRDIQKDVKIVNDGKTTMAYRVLPNTVEFSLSVASPDEKKFRAKVGEFCARSRMDSGETVKMDKNDFRYMVECLFGIYEV